MQIAVTALAFFSTHAFADYAEDRALIEGLQARCLFAFDFGDPEGYANTFAPDGVLNFGWGDIVGREAIAAFIEDGRHRESVRRRGDQASEERIAEEWR